MIKIALKHFLYEQAINVFFKEVVKNFVRPNLEQSVVDAIIGWANHIRMQETPIGCKTRRLSSQYTLETHELTSYHGEDIEDMLLEVLREELDREIRGGYTGWSSGTRDSGIIYAPYIPAIFSTTEKS